MEKLVKILETIPKIYSLCLDIYNVLAIIKDSAVGNNQNNKMSIQEAADYLHCKIPTIYSKTSSRELKHYKVGNKLIFYKTDLDNYIKTCEVKSGRELDEIASKYINSEKK